MSVSFFAIVDALSFPYSSVAAASNEAVAVS
jgi:hypothetical protein